MNLKERFLKSQLELAKPLVNRADLDFARSVQDRIGRLITFSKRQNTVVENESFGGAPGALVIPRDEVRGGVIIYIHGGGFTCGGLDYAKGFASVLSAECGMRAITLEYPLAPEHPYPAPLDTLLDAYRDIIKVYPPETVLLAGESAGGGLCFSLALKLREHGLPMPAGIVAMSPWCDLTLSGESYETNKKNDPSLTKERLEFFADCYVGARNPDDTGKGEVSDEDALLKKSNPYISPLFANLEGLPPSLIFAGGDEILLSDSVEMDKKLKEYGSCSKLVVRPGMWHAYHLYGTMSSKADFDHINLFIKHIFPKSTQRKLRWMHLDNAAKIYPAAATSRWTNIFRLSATLTEPVNREVLKSALDVTVRRFPSIAVRLRRGMFWYYLEEIPHAPEIVDEKPMPLSRMPFDDIRFCAFRVLVYKNRIAVEFFHALTDGNGGLVFLKSLLAEYITQRYSEKIPAEFGVLDRLEPPRDEELEDSFVKNSGKYPYSRKDTDSYRILGTPEPDGYHNNTTFIMSVPSLVEKAKAHKVSVTAFMAAAFIKAGMEIQREEVKNAKNYKPVKVLIPVDLRRVFESESLRNFALYVTPGVNPKYGEYEFDELCGIVAKIMSLEINKKTLAAKIRTNVKDEENMILKLMPLFVKNVAMKAVFSLVGERKSSLTLSNLGVVELPEAMKKYIDRFDFVLGPQERAPYNVGMLSYKNDVYMNIIRNTVEPRFEMKLYEVLRSLGIHIKVESNQR